MLRTWVFEFFPELTDQAAAASGQSTPQYFADYLSLWQRDEALGFDGIFFSEHHFGSSFSSSPNLLIAATAVKTTTIRLGVMGVVVPYYPAARIVEEIGLLDQLSGGRLEIGTAIGVPQELAQVGLTMDQANFSNTTISRFCRARRNRRNRRNGRRLLALIPPAKPPAGTAGFAQASRRPTK